MSGARVRVPRPTEPDLLEVWITRDSGLGPDGATGDLYQHVDVWTVRPTGLRDDVGRYWLPISADIVKVHAGRYTLDDAKRRFRTLPDTDLECIHCFIKRGF
jgi:hypothetical protein